MIVNIDWEEQQRRMLYGDILLVASLNNRCALPRYLQATRFPCSAEDGEE